MIDRPLRILILEDNEVVIEVLKAAISRHFAGAQLRIERQTDRLADLTPDKAGQFNCILLDYVCLTGGNFHQAPLEAMGIEHVISMSSTDNFNSRAIARGVPVAIKKPLHVAELEDFAKAIVETINRILPKKSTAANRWPE